MHMSDAVPAYRNNISNAQLLLKLRHVEDFGQLFQPEIRDMADRRWLRINGAKGSCLSGNIPGSKIHAWEVMRHPKTDMTKDAKIHIPDNVVGHSVDCSLPWVEKSEKNINMKSTWDYTIGTLAEVNWRCMATPIHRNVKGDEKLSGRHIPAWQSEDQENLMSLNSPVSLILLKPNG
jgi:hypothetical protein